MEYLFIKTRIDFCGGTVQVVRAGDFGPLVGEHPGFVTAITLSGWEELFSND